MQLNMRLVRALRREFDWIAVETNGTIDPGPHLLWSVDWISVSPKLGCRTKPLTNVDEVRFVLSPGLEPWDTKIRALHRFVSPAFDAHLLNPAALAWCVGFVRNNPTWRLSIQQHKIWGIR